MVEHAKEFERRIYVSQALDFIEVMKELSKALRYIPGMKNILLFSSGISNLFFSSSVLETLEELGKELSSSSTSVFSINTEGEALSHFKDRDFSGDSSLRYLSKLSGGKYFDNILSTEMISGEIQKMTGVFYVLGYQVEEIKDGKYHDIKVKVKRKGCKVYGQKGYFNSKPFSDFTETEKLFHLIDLAISEKPYFQERIQFPIKTFPFLEEKPYAILISEVPKDTIGKISGAKGEIVRMIFDKNLNLIESKSKEINLTQFRNDTFFSSIFPLSPGNYEIRVVLRNLETGKGAVGSCSINIPEERKGFRIDPPLLLKTRGNQNIIELEKIEDSSLLKIYPFDPEKYVPLIGKAKRGERIFAIFPLILNNIEEPEISILVILTHLQSGESLSLSPFLLEKKEGRAIYQVEIPKDNLQIGKYSLYLLAEEKKTNSKSYTKTIFEVE